MKMATNKLWLFMTYDNEAPDSSQTFIVRAPSKDEAIEDVFKLCREEEGTNECSIESRYDQGDIHYICLEVNNPHLELVLKKGSFTLADLVFPPELSLTKENFIDVSTKVMDHVLSQKVNRVNDPEVIKALENSWHLFQEENHPPTGVMEINGVPAYLIWVNNTHFIYIPALNLYYITADSDPSDLMPNYYEKPTS